MRQAIERRAMDSRGTQGRVGEEKRVRLAETAGQVQQENNEGAGTGLLGGKMKWTRKAGLKLY